MRERGGGYVVQANEYSCARGAQISFGDLTSYLTYGREGDELLKIPWELLLLSPNPLLKQTYDQMMQ
jgi:hypothetical protein